jgi:hypothetical protein
LTREIKTIADLREAGSGLKKQKCHGTINRKARRVRTVAIIEIGLVHFKTKQILFAEKSPGNQQ